MKFVVRYLRYDSLSHFCSQHACLLAVYDTAEEFDSVTPDRNRALPGKTRSCGISSKGNTTYKSQSRQGGVMKSIISIAVVIFLACSISGCGGYSSHGNTPLNQTLAGTWDFTYVSSTGGSSTVSGTFTQTIGAFSANVALTGTCASTGMLTGTVSGSAITGTLTETNPETITVMGSLDTSGSTASGTYQVMSATGACAAATGGSGTWSGSRTAVPVGPYSAMVRTANRLPVQVTLNLNGDASNLSGTANFNNSACLHSMQVTGSQTGSHLELRGDNGNDGSIVFSGTTDRDARILTLNSAVSGACQDESGVGAFTKVQ